MRTTVSLSERRRDIPILVFFLINLPFICYFVDVEQVTQPKPLRYVEELDRIEILVDESAGTWVPYQDEHYPIWPPRWQVDLNHWWGKNFDPVQLARPVWWKVTIWIDSLFFGPFYAFAIYAFVRGREWIRMPSIIYSSVLLTIMATILSEELAGAHATHATSIVLLANAPWALMPVYILVRMLTDPRPFTRAVEPPGEERTAASAT